MGFDIVSMEFDPTGVALSNRVEDEDVVIPDVLANRVVALHHGTFYSESLTMRMYDGTPLVKWVDYRPVHLYTEIMDKTDKTPCCFIQILNTNIMGRAVATYNAVGYPYKFARQDLVDILYALQQDRRPYYWDNVLEKPDAYPPLPHPLDLYDTFNWADSIGAMNAFGTALANLDLLPDPTVLASELNQFNTSVKTRFNVLENLLRGHERNTNNAHANSISKIVGLTNVDDYAMATTTDMNSKSGTTHLSPGVLKGYLTSLTDALYVEGVPRDLVPMLQIGDLSTDGLPITFAGWVLNCDSIPVMMDRNEYVVPARSISLINHARKTMYLYIRIVEHVAEYVITDSATMYPESPTSSYIGKITVGADSILSVSSAKVSGIDFYRVATAPQGSVITATTGLPSETGVYAWK